MGKSDLFIERCSHREASQILNHHHYLKDISKGFRSGVNIGLYRGDRDTVFLPNIQGVCIFTGLPVPEVAVGAFGLDRDDQRGLFELSRLCLLPTIQASEHNVSSWFVAKCLRLLRSTESNARAVISYADSGFHIGTIYAASNFIYCGLSDEKFDYIGQDGKPLSRGSSQYGKRARTRKHRFVKVFDKSIDLKWPVHKWERNATTPKAD